MATSIILEMYQNEGLWVIMIILHLLIIFLRFQFDFNLRVIANYIYDVFWFDQLDIYLN